ncbi:P-loop containing nucleoside triphosphate hydrolase protein [Mycena crocata]|nr:P-loop containing nucleoside triphosphate hydrolase protein [Mycena crocata]
MEKSTTEQVAMEATEKSSKAILDDYSYTTVRLGVWRLLLPQEARSFSDRFAPIPMVSSLYKRWIELKALAPKIWRFVTEIYNISPVLVTLVLILGSASACERTVMLYASTRLLRTVEVGLAEAKPNINAILQALLLRVACVILTSTISWIQTILAPKLQTRVKLHFEEYILRTKLQLDLPTSSADKKSQQIMSAGQAWRTFTFLSGVFSRAFQLASQIIFISQQASGGFTFTLLSLVSPLFLNRLGRYLWMQAYVVYSDNVDYLRLRALYLMSAENYREDVISSDIGTWIANEYKKARDLLGNTSDEHASWQYAVDATPMRGILSSLSSDLPTLYWAMSAILKPKTLTVTSFAVLQQHAQGLNNTFSMMYYDFTTAAQHCSYITELYDMEEIQNKIADGDEPYPNPMSSDKGMGFELRNVSFAYPGGKSKDNAIRNVSFKIPAGHLVVIVGANGSGKSTIIKLLNRLYDVDSGEILVDGIPIKNYRIPDLRKVQALLTQDHKLFPLTLAENIGLGNSDRVHDMEMVMKAAESGGALDVIKKLKDGVQTVLEPVKTASGSNLDKEKHKKLQSILEELEKKAEVSGGEKQRLVASRTFMRFLSGNIRFAVADEPSSALDPKAEHQLFERLRASGEGKTLIFVTHRFGHLTKHADLIICMKDGAAVELGTHKELLARGGEYSELYNVQAQAFSESAS